MLDFHAHILPDADHGSDGIETSLRQLELAEQAGIDTIVATPHFYPQSDSLSRFLRRRDRTYAELMAHYHGPIRVVPGCECHVCVGIEHLEGIAGLCAEGTDVILLELPFSQVTGDVINTMDIFREETGLNPILAHVDRYKKDVIEYLFAQGMRGQINAEPLCRCFPPRHFLRWIDEGHVVALGSDIHLTKIGYSQYLKAVAKLKGRAQILEQRMRELIPDTAGRPAPPEESEDPEK